jgi:hypothetical protein
MWKGMNGGLEGSRTLRSVSPYIQIEIHNRKKDRKERVNTILGKFLNDEYTSSHNFFKFHGDFFFKRKDL